MRSTIHGPEAFLLKSKKPHVQELVARCRTMTDDEIKALPEKPDVITGLLNIKKADMQAASASRAEILADLMTKMHHPDMLSG